MPKFLRKVIRVRAEDSPNVKVALELTRQGKVVPPEPILPGVLSWELYQHRRKTWDPVRQCVGLDGQFYEGAQTLLYPPEWLNLAERFARESQIASRSQAVAMGVDTAEGGDSTCWAITSELGLIRLISIKTPDTAVITSRTIALIQEYGIADDMVMFDQGGGGQEHADRLRYQGYNVRTVSFGESVAPEPVRFLKPFEEKLIERRERYTYKNRRAQMYWLLRQRLDPGTSDTPYPNYQGQPFGIPSEGEEFQELRRQLAVMPLLWDDEGKIVMLPKRKKATATPSAQAQSLEELLGRSPDEADAVVLAVFAMDPGSKPVVIKSMW